MTELQKKIYDLIKNFYKKWNKCPGSNYLAYTLNIDSEVIIKTTDELIELGFLKRNRNNSLLLKQKKGPLTTKVNYGEKIIEPTIESIKAAKKGIEKMEKEINNSNKARVNNVEYVGSAVVDKNFSIGGQTDKKKKPKKKIKMTKIVIMKFMIIVIFIAMYYLGIKANFKAFILTRDFPDAIISAIGFFTFGIIMADVFIFWKINKKKHAWIFLILFIITFTNNFTNIFQSQFNTYQDILYSSENVKTDNKNKIYLNNLKQEKELESKLHNYEIEIERHREELNNDIPKWKKTQINGYIWTIINKRIPPVEIKIESLRKLNNSYLSSTESSDKKVSFYYFVSFGNKLVERSIQMFHLMLPSFIYELIASISLALLFFMKE